MANWNAVIMNEQHRLETGMTEMCIKAYDLLMVFQCDDKQIALWNTFDSHGYFEEKNLQELLNE